LAIARKSTRARRFEPPIFVAGQTLDNYEDKLDMVALFSYSLRSIIVGRHPQTVVDGAKRVLSSSESKRFSAP
jgi:hypothetical protein